VNHPSLLSRGQRSCWPFLFAHRILEEADLIAPFSFFANEASTLQESTLTYRRPMPKKNNLPTGGRNTAPPAAAATSALRTQPAFYNQK